MRAELRLSAWPHHVHHAEARNLEGSLMSEVVFDQCQSQVHAGRHASRGPDVAVAHIDCVSVYVNCRVIGFHLRAPEPMRAGAFAIQKAGFCEQ